MRVAFRMDSIRIMVAIEPRAYREAIGSTLRELRPETCVVIVLPEELDREVLRLHPHMVLCSELTATVREQALTWIVLYPDLKPLVMISVDGDEAHPTDLTVHGLVEIVDRTARLLTTSRAPLQPPSADPTTPPFS
jgi:hypothetical protein